MWGKNVKENGVCVTKKISKTHKNPHVLYSCGVCFACKT